MDIYTRIHQCLDELGIEDHGMKNVHVIFRAMMDFFPDRVKMLALQVGENNALRDLERQKRRTDKIREAVIAYLEGELSKKKLERALHQTDYSQQIAE